MTEKELCERLSNIKIVVMDVDGTYTNGLLFYDSNGEVMKGFHSHDGLALELLRLAGIKRGFITGRKDNATKARADYLKVDFHLDNIGDKGVVLKKLLSDYGLSESECIYIGDDLNDLTAFEIAGICVATANATHEVKRRADFVTGNQGGSGAIREVVEMILRAKKIDPVELWNSGKGNIVGGQ